MNTLEITLHTGQIGGAELNALALGDAGGDALITVGRLGIAEMFSGLVNVNFPSLNPRVCIPAETNVAKAGC